MIPLFSHDEAGPGAAAGSSLSHVPARAVLDACAEGIYLVDTTGVCRYANSAVGELLGHDVAFLIGSNIHSVIHHSRPDGSPLPPEECPMYQAVVLGTPAQADDEVLWRADGTPVAVDYRSRPLRVDGQLVGAVVTFNDATERHVATAELAGILATAGDAFMAVDGDAVITGWNPAAESLLGWTASEAIGRTMAEIVVPARDHASHAARMEHLQALDDADLPIGPLEATARSKDGREIAIELTVGRMRSGDGWRFHSFLRDVTERRAMARALETSEMLYRHLAEHSGDMISRHGVDGRLRYVSPASVKLLGLTPDDLLGRYAREFVHPDDLDGLPKTDAETAETEHRQEVTYRLRHRDGHWVWVEAVRSVLTDDRGKVTEIQLTTRNITDRKAREEENQQASRLESLGRLSAGLAHEINSPIQYVGDNSRFLADAYQQLLGLVTHCRALLKATDSLSSDDRLARLREATVGIEFDYLQGEIPVAIEQTLEGIERVSTIVRAMKTFSHPGGREHAPANLNEALTATVTVTRSQVSGVADLRMELADLPPVRCSIADLNQAFLNLIVNAADAIEETGRRGTIRISSEVDGDQAVVRISDDGAGIPDDVLPKIFDPFFTTKDVGRGSGQGLPLVRTVVEKGHGGTLTVDSEPGIGTTFTLRLPICRDTEQSRSA